MLPKPLRQQQGQTTIVLTRAVAQAAAWMLDVRMQSVRMSMPLSRLSWRTSGSAARSCRDRWRSCWKNWRTCRARWGTELVAANLKSVYIASTHPQQLEWGA